MNWPDFETNFVHLGRLSFLVRRTGVVRELGLPRYVSIRGRGGHRRLFWRVYWLRHDFRC